MFVYQIPGGAIEDSEVLDGVMFNKDILHPKMRRYIENPRILLIDSGLEYSKGESQTNIEMQSSVDFELVPLFFLRLTIIEFTRLAILMPYRGIWCVQIF